MVKNKKRRGTPPLDQPHVKPSAPPKDYGSPKIGFRLIQSGWGVENLSASQALVFLAKWQKRASMTWDKVTLADRHGLGSETLPASRLLPAVPNWMEKDFKLLVLRHEGRLPQVGIRVGDVFEVMWIETKFNTLYSHDAKNRR